MTATAMMIVLQRKIPPEKAKQSWYSSMELEANKKPVIEVDTGDDNK